MEPERIIVEGDYFMKQIKVINAYAVTEELSKSDNLSIQAKWVLYRLRKDLLPHYDFYIQESRALFNRYETTNKGDFITFKSPELAAEYKESQQEIDDFEVEFNNKQTLKLSDIPNITVQQIELLDDFIEFLPE